MTETTYVFDLFGTLVDYASLREDASTFAAEPERFVLAWRQKQIAYAFAATLTERYVDFDTLTAAAFDYVASSLGLAPDGSTRARTLAAWARLPAFPDASPALAALRARGARTAVLSNGTPAGIAATLHASGLTAAFDATLSIDTVRRYKPHPAAYALATERFATTPEHIVFVSSNGWDASGAAEFGFRVVWCNRSGLPRETLGRSPHRTIATLDDIISSG